MLDDEEQSDRQLRDQFKERWSRTSSGTLTKPMRDESNKYKHILDTAIGADKIVKEKYEKHKNAIAILSKSPVSINVELNHLYSLVEIMYIYLTATSLKTTTSFLTSCHITS